MFTTDTPTHGPITTMCIIPPKYAQRMPLLAELETSTRRFYEGYPDWLLPNQGNPAIDYWIEELKKLPTIANVNDIYILTNAILYVKMNPLYPWLWSTLLNGMLCKLYRVT